MAKKHNPFAIFRRNQKVMLGWLTLFTMFSFIVLGTMYQCTATRHPSNGQQNVVYAVTKDFGELDQRAFQSYQNELQMTGTFIEMAVYRLAQSQRIFQLPYDGSFCALVPDPKDPQKQVPVSLSNLTSTLQEIRFSLSSSENIVNRWLLYQKAKKDGYTYDVNTSIRNYLDSLFGGTMGKADLDAVMPQAGIRSYHELNILIGDQIIFERFMRSVAKAKEFNGFAEQAPITGQGSIPSAPSEQFSSFLKLRQKSRIDAAAFKAEDFIKDVPDPDEKTMQNFYEKYKLAQYSPISSEPGFHLPARLAFQIVKAELTDERIKAVTDAEVKDFYEKHKEEFKKPAPAAEPKAPADDLKLPGEGLDLPAEEVKAPAKNDSADKAKPADTKKADAPKPEAPKDSKKSSENIKDNPFRLVSYEAEAKKADAPKADAKPAEVKKADAPKADAKPAEAKKADAPKADAKPAEVKKADTPKADAKPADNGYFPLSDVSEYIRRQIAQEKLNKELDEVLAEMDKFSQNYETATPLDLKSIAAKHGFTYSETVSKPADGKVKAEPRLMFYEEAAIENIMPGEVLTEAYRNSSSLEYTPQKTEKMVNGAYYLYWCNKLEAEKSPDFEEAKPYIIKTWKRLEAQKLAKKAAEALAEKVKAEKKPLAEVVKTETGKPVVFATTQKFSWYDQPMGPQMSGLNLGEVREEKVDFGKAGTDNKVLLYLGEDFYETVFNLKLLEVATVANALDDRYFVVQMMEKDSEETLIPVFETSTMRDYGQVFAQSRMMANIKFYKDLIEDLKKECGFEWIVVPGENKRNR